MLQEAMEEKFYTNGYQKLEINAPAEEDEGRENHIKDGEKNLE